MRQATVLFLVASAALAAAVATAHIFVPLPDGTSFGTDAKAEAAPTSAAPPIATQPKSLVEARQAPVPFLARERPARVAPPAPLNATSQVVLPASEHGAGGEGRHFARDAIEADGYKSVRDIVPGPDGTWHGRALRGRTEVIVTVDREGRVSAD